MQKFYSRYPIALEDCVFPAVVYRAPATKSSSSLAYHRRRPRNATNESESSEHRQRGEWRLPPRTSVGTLYSTYTISLAWTRYGKHQKKHGPEIQWPWFRDLEWYSLVNPLPLPDLGVTATTMIMMTSKTERLSWMDVPVE
jgi:hypothetical protein